MRRKERKQLRQRELWQKILMSAREIVASEGWGSVSIKTIANKIGCSPQDIYQYFRKEAILSDLMLEGYRMLISDIQIASQSPDKPEEILDRIIHIYWDFAWNHIDLYSAMYGIGGVPFMNRDETDDVRKVIVIMSDLLERILNTKGLECRDVTNKVNMVLALMHGIISSAFNERRVNGKERGAIMAKTAVRWLVDSWNIGA